MNRIIFSLFSLLFSLILFILPAFGQDLSSDLNRKFSKYSLVQLDSAAILRKVDKNEEALIGSFQVNLNTNNLFSNRLIASETPATVKPVKGKLKGSSNTEKPIMRFSVTAPGIFLEVPMAAQLSHNLELPEINLFLPITMMTGRQI